MMRKMLRAVRSTYRSVKRKYFNGRITKEERAELDAIAEEFPRVLSTTNSIRMIVEKNLSVCRFGDAEFDIARQKSKNDPYQVPSEELSSRLLSILNAGSTEKILVCIPPFNSPYNNSSNFYKDLSFWEWYWLKNFKVLKTYFSYEYGNSFLSRNTVFYENSIETICDIWRNRKVVFVTGRNSRFVKDGRLFGNIASSNNLYVPPINAFEEYPHILQKCLEFPTDRLFLVAAGPTATILCYDLANSGYQAIDIGHITNCYRQFLGESPAPEALPFYVGSPKI